MPAETVDRAQRWRQAVARGRRWLATQADAAPPFGAGDADLNWYCKVPWALAGAGDRDAALRALGVAYDRFIHPVLRVPRQTQWTNAVAYALGWLVSAACACQARDLPDPIYACLQQHTCAQTGGLITDGDWFDASIQGAALHATAMMRDVAAIRRIGDTMARFVDDQPCPREAIHTHFHPQRGYFTDISPDDRSGRYVFLRGAPKQPLANLGFVMQGLCRAGEAIGEPRYIEAAQRLLDLVLRNHRDDLIAHSQNHKVAHAAAMLWRHTRRADLRDIAATMADRVALNIQPDGRALADVFYSHVADQPPYFTVRTTCDSVLWLAGLCDELHGAETAAIHRGSAA